MNVIDTSEFSEPKNQFEALLVYNALDCMLTREVHGVISQQLDDTTHATYTFELALQAPVLEMCLRGIKISGARRQTMLSTFVSQESKLRARLNLMAQVFGLHELNPNSPKQLHYFFYEVLKLPKVVSFKKGERKVSTDRDALEKLSKHHLAKPFISHILALRDVRKKVSVLRTKIDPDGRMRASFNIAGTETGRWSSSEGATGSGTNMQNITESLRRVFVADPGMKMAYIDLEQAESRLVAAIVYDLFDDTSYLDACESGDLHTTVCKLIWPNLGWTGNLREDKAIAESPFYRHFSYRDMSKRGGHGTNYYGQPATMAKFLHVDKSLMESFQNAYFAAFPGIPRWHAHTAKVLQTKGAITSLLGRRRQFHGRLYDDSTLREAIAFNPQSSIADVQNAGLLNLWRRGHELNIQLLAQVHDAVLIQYPEHDEARALALAAECLEVPFTVKDREIKIPTEAASGWNWSYMSESNPDGLRKYNGHDERTRQEDPEASKLDRLLS